MEVRENGTNHSVIVVHPDFDDVDKGSRHKCCCNRIHVKKGAIAVGVVESICCLLTVIIVGLGYGGNQSDNKRYAMFVQGLVGSSLLLLVVNFMFGGIQKKSAYFLIPHLVLQILIIIWSIIMTIAMIIFLCNKVSENENVTTRAKVGFSIGICLVFLVAVIEIWFFVVVLKCFRYLRDLTVGKPT